MGCSTCTATETTATFHGTTSRKSLVVIVLYEIVIVLYEIVYIVGVVALMVVVVQVLDRTTSKD